MAHTLCFSGMDRAEEAKLKLLLADANEWLGGEWSLAPENDAEVLIIDLESMYGHMTWLKMHNSGRFIIALCSREQSEAEHLLLRPVTVESMVTALAEAIGKPVPQRTAMSAGDAMVSARQAGADSPTPQTARANKPLPAPPQERPSHPDMQPPVQHPSRAAITQEHPATPPMVAPHTDVQVPRAQDAQERPPHTDVQVPRAQDAQEQSPPTSPAAQPSTPPQPRPPAPPAKPRDLVLSDYLHPGKLFGTSKLELEGAPPLVIDPESDTYIGGIALKPYIPYCQLGSVRVDQWQAVNPVAVKQLTAELGGVHALARLRWLHALMQGGGAIAPGYDAGDKFQLTRWPKTEREFPRHFRIATAMMQGPATLTEIATQSNTTRDEVTDFVNASLDSGFAEPYTPPPPTPEPPARSGGLLGRLRGRINS